MLSLQSFQQLPTFKANRGNLMQHWTLCELLKMLRSVVTEATDLHYVDAYSMAPWSRPEPRNNQTRHIFHRAAERLSRRAIERPDGAFSDFEAAWSSLSSDPARLYPSSALFVRGLWKNDVSYSLCEIDRIKASMIAQWGASVVTDENCTDFEIHCRPWQRGLPIRPDAKLHLIQFDPYGFRCQPPQSSPNLGMMYPSDLRSLIKQTQQIERIALMMSFYDSMEGNSAKLVSQTVTQIISEGGFTPLWDINADKATLSLVYVRGIELPDRWVDTPQRWNTWLNELESSNRD